MASRDGIHRTEMADDKQGNPLSNVGWNNLFQEMFEFAAPIINSAAFSRLGSIAFLGLLSARFKNLVTSPLHVDARGYGKYAVFEGSRRCHSINVAWTLLGLSRNLGLSRKAQKYAICWGLLHDIATWPLSHTGEPAFSEITRNESKSLRKRMILGSEYLPESLSFAKILLRMGIDPSTLIELYQKKPSDLDHDLEMLWQIVKSPITPDTLDGIWRAGLSFGIYVPHPAAVVASLSIKDSDLFVLREKKDLIIRFWEKKSWIYKHIINHPDVVQWESAWSYSIRNNFQGLDLVESLGISEMEIIKKIQRKNLLPQSHVYRYKWPNSYYVCQEKKKMLDSDLPLGSLFNILKKKVS